MRTYTEALAKVGERELYSFASGRNRYLAWERDLGDVTVSIYGNVIATFHPDDSVTLDAAGYHTASTVDGLNHAVFRTVTGNGPVSRRGGVVHYRSTPLIEPLRIGPDGEPPKVVRIETPRRVAYVQLRRGKRGASVVDRGQTIVKQVPWGDEIRESMSDDALLAILLGRQA